MLRAVVHALLNAVLISVVLQSASIAASPVVSDRPELAIPADTHEDSTGIAELPMALLLEASDTGKTGAVPFSGTTLWSTGFDELGKPVIKAKVHIPARNLRLDFTLRFNSDPTLPASHLVEMNFLLPDSFIGGSIASVPGILLKNEELKTGTPLIGAGARVVTNQHLFALSASPQDLTSNYALLDGQRYLDIPLIYANGKRALLTLQRDTMALQQFVTTHGAWNTVASAGAGHARPGPYVVVSSSRSRADAEQALIAARKQLGSLLPADGLQILQMDLGPKGIFHRVISRTASYQEAVSLCVDIKATGSDCLPVN